MEHFLILFQQPIDFGAEFRAKLMERQAGYKTLDTGLKGELKHHWNKLAKCKLVSLLTMLSTYVNCT